MWHKYYEADHLQSTYHVLDTSNSHIEETYEKN